MPAGMDYAKAGKIQPDWQTSKPAQSVRVVGRVFFDLMKKSCVLARIFVRMTPQETPTLASNCPIDRVEFVISHYCKCCAGFTHRAGNPHSRSLLGAAIYEITNKDHFSFWMPEHTFDFGLIELL
jgi:hypothetical protein